MVIKEQQTRLGVDEFGGRAESLDEVVEDAGAGSESIEEDNGPGSHTEL